MTKRVYASTTFTPVQSRPGQRNLEKEPDVIYPRLCFVIEDFGEAYDALVRWGTPLIALISVARHNVDA